MDVFDYSVARPGFQLAEVTVCLRLSPGMGAQWCTVSWGLLYT